MKKTLEDQPIKPNKKAESPCPAKDLGPSDNSHALGLM
ncbi:hypothetical protein SynRS9902_03002 [Synechococcus sp. RS9902]|nr:hypothetical protein SynRS9902_03002 [Synechococcus sp. RS9902]